MCIAQLTIVPASSSRKARADVDDATQGYLAHMYKHGQMYGEPRLWKIVAPTTKGGRTAGSREFRLSL